MKLRGESLGQQKYNYYKRTQTGAKYIFFNLLSIPHQEIHIQGCITNIHSVLGGTFKQEIEPNDQVCAITHHTIKFAWSVLLMVMASFCWGSRAMRVWSQMVPINFNSY